jgi:hypothetical protein
MLFGSSKIAVSQCARTDLKQFGNPTVQPCFTFSGDFLGSHGRPDGIFSSVIALRFPTSGVCPTHKLVQRATVCENDVVVPTRVDASRAAECTRVQQ